MECSQVVGRSMTPVMMTIASAWNPLQISHPPSPLPRNSLAGWLPPSLSSYYQFHSGPILRSETQTISGQTAEVSIDGFNIGLIQADPG
ncbi:uncharacterized protein BDW47DRAFT_111482 [Aspergillus candidus]|uniref:Uncharacterized protein n=1 Tax=Aspergillus candidus TaxID=41067 RepID=A0A2I2F2F7_ASPCN|nr:hypothetical protein BDW47DRAFT_111482 [Aspergillus candidus]PLB34813.1 hypothetical protein BDW47DRAFT_111482 [Aspergillus candidus]